MEWGNKNMFNNILMNTGMMSVLSKHIYPLYISIHISMGVYMDVYNQMFTLHACSLCIHTFLCVFCVCCVCAWSGKFPGCHAWDWGDKNEVWGGVYGCGWIQDVNQGCRNKNMTYRVGYSPQNTHLTTCQNTEKTQKQHLKQ